MVKGQWYLQEVNHAHVELHERWGCTGERIGLSHPSSWCLGKTVVISVCRLSAHLELCSLTTISKQQVQDNTQLALIQDTEVVGSGTQCEPDLHSESETS